MDLARSATDSTHGIRLKVETLFAEVAKFGVIGIIAFAIDIGVFNLLRVAGDGFFVDKPLTAKVISVTLSTTFAYFGNRFWTFRDRGRTSMRREYLLFFALNAIGLMISLGCLWFSHYALGFTSLLEDNLSGNVIGVGLGTLFRFWAYRKWVFPEEVVAATSTSETSRPA